MKNLTTGEMIDRLNMGDTALNESGQVVKYNQHGILVMWHEGEVEPSLREEVPFEITVSSVGEEKWDITPHFVTFQEAQEAYMNENKTIIFYQTESLQYPFTPGKYGQFQSLGNDDINIGELIKGNWIIVNRSRIE